VLGTRRHAGAARHLLPTAAIDIFLSPGGIANATLTTRAIDTIPTMLALHTRGTDVGVAECVAGARVAIFVAAAFDLSSIVKLHERQAKQTQPRAVPCLSAPTPGGDVGHGHELGCLSDLGIALEVYRTNHD